VTLFLDDILMEADHVTDAGQRRLRCGAPRRRRRSSRAPRCSLHRRSTESRRPSSLATDPIERPLDAKINRLPLVVVRERPTLTSFHPTPPGSFEPTTGVHQFGGGSRFENGLLVIDLVREIPETMKPRRIEINGASPSNVTQIEAKAA
jgi:hypothetical protein